MRRGRQADDADGHPQIVRARGEHDRHDTQRADQHRGLAPRVHAPSTLDQRRGQPSARDAADIGDEVDRHDRRANPREIQAVVPEEEIGHPEQIQPPNRIGHELADREGPGLTMPQQPCPGNPRDVLRRIAADVGELRLGQRGMVFGPAIERDPERQPHEADGAGENERPAPAVEQRDRRHHERRDDGADVGAGVEDASGQRALPPRKPLRGRLDRRREIARFAEAEPEAGHAEAHHRARKRVRHRRDTPEDECERVAHFRPDPVDDRAHQQQANRVRQLKREDDVRVVDFVPAQIVLKRRFQNADHLPVDVVDRGGEEQQRANHPAETPDAHTGCGGGGQSDGRWRGHHSAFRDSRSTTRGGGVGATSGPSDSCACSALSRCSHIRLSARARSRARIA